MRCLGLLFSRLRWLIERAGMGRQVLTIATATRHGPELIFKVPRRRMGGLRGFG